MANHEKCFAVCENKCFVETLSKEQITNELGELSSVGHALEADHATTATTATYASSDTSKGTIEQRLTNLGFKEGTIVFQNSSQVHIDSSKVQCSIKRQGNYVIGELIFLDDGASNYVKPTSSRDILIATIPSEFKPKEAVSTTAGYFGNYNQTPILGYISINNAGNITLGWMDSVYNSIMYFQRRNSFIFGYEAKPISSGGGSIGPII